MLELSDDEFDDFEDAAADIMQSMDAQNEGSLKDNIEIDGSYYKPAATPVIIDCDHERVAIPCLNKPNTKISWWGILKELIGKDITRVAMPV